MSLLGLDRRRSLLSQPSDNESETAAAAPRTQVWPTSAPQRDLSWPVPTATLIPRTTSTFSTPKNTGANTSPVLRDLAVLSSVRLNASSRALASFLTAAFGGVPFPDGANVLCALDTLLLLQQNDCMRPLQSAITELKVRVMEGEVCPMQAFVLGAHLRDLDLCRTAIVYGDVPAATPAPPPASYKAQVDIKTKAVDDDDVFYSDSEDESDSSDSSFCSPTRLTYEADVLDANKSVMEHLERIPQEYRSAMTHAWNSSSDPKDRGNSFVRLMCLLQRRVLSKAGG